MSFQAYLDNMGYPAEEFPPRPRYPLEFTLFEDRYPELTDEMVEDAILGPAMLPSPPNRCC